jgi:hypothetical protein
MKVNSTLHGADMTNVTKGPPLLMYFVMNLDENSYSMVECLQPKHPSYSRRDKQTIAAPGVYK